MTKKLICRKGFLLSATQLRQGNVFTPVCHSVHGGGGCLAEAPPPRADTPGQTAPWTNNPLPLGRHPLGRHNPPRDGHYRVRILLECILVMSATGSKIIYSTNFLDQMLKYIKNLEQKISQMEKERLTRVRPH